MEEILKTGVSPDTDMLVSGNIDPELAQLLSLLENPLVMAAFVALMIWSLVWKGLALWRAARNSHMYWFIAILGANTMGILEIIYIFGFSKKQKKTKKHSDPITL